MSLLSARRGRPATDRAHPGPQAHWGTSLVGLALVVGGALSMLPVRAAGTTQAGLAYAERSPAEVAPAGSATESSFTRTVQPRPAAKGTRQPNQDVQPSVTTPPGWSASAERARTAALDRALVYLAQAQSADGGWSMADARERAPVAVTALGALALMSSGSPPGRGPHGAQVARSVDFLLSRVDLIEDSPTRGYIGVSGDPLSRMHGHGFGTLALAEAFAISPQSPRGARLERALPAAVDLIERTQGSEGGWYYAPEVEAEHEGSVTICLVQALRAARNSGLLVDREIISRAVDYVRRSQAPDGSFRYQIGSDRTSIALTAAAIGTLHAAGEYDTPAITRGIDSIWRELGNRANTTKTSGADFPHYERLYLAQALWRLGDEQGFWRWYGEELQVLLDAQQPNGAYLDRTYGSAYATAMVALYLALPDEFLPSFAR